MGLDAAGKTTMAYMLQPEQPLPPRFGFHVESFDYENLSFTVWDPATNDRLVAFRRQHYKGVQGIVFVADSCDRERLGEASEELQELLRHEELHDVPLLVFANKQDLSRAMTCEEVSQALRLQELSRPWFAQGSCACRKEGLQEGLDWLVRAVLRGA